VADLTGLQARFKHVKYLIINERSIADLETPGIVDERLSYVRSFPIRIFCRSEA
jgi:hypothetical protein